MTTSSTSYKQDGKPFPRPIEPAERELGKCPGASTSGSCVVWSHQTFSTAIVLWRPAPLVMPKPASSDSVRSIPSSDASEFNPEANDEGPEKKRRRVSVPRRQKDRLALLDAPSLDIEEAAGFVHRPHGANYHDVKDIAALQGALLDWFDGIRSAQHLDSPYNTR